MIVIELKRHWDTPLRVCSQPKPCTRPVFVGESRIGETTSLFTNGFLSAYQHRLDRGGTLSSSYYSAHGRDYLLLVALTDLSADLDGASQSLSAGQVYACEATQVEITAKTKPARWVVLRIEIPKTETPER